MRSGRSLRFILAGMTWTAACVALTFGVSTAQAVNTPWTAAKASAALHAKCVRVAGGFKCRTATGKVLWAKPRPDNAKLCQSRVSLKAISRACLTVPAQGTVNDAALAMGRAIQQRFSPGSTTPWQVALPTCSRTSPTVFACSVDVPLLKASATVTWAAGVPLVVFTSFVCGDADVGRPGC